MAHKVDSSTAVAVMPTPGSAGTGGWFVGGNPDLGVPGTVVTADWLNAQQAEVLNVLTAAGITPSKTNQAQLLQAIRTLARIKLTANLTLYVATTGNDTTGTGASGTPFATLNKAWSHLLSSYDLNGFQATIQVANGTYNTPFGAYAAPVGAFNGPVIIQGNTSVPSSVIINVANNCCMNFYNAGAAIVRGFRLIASGTVGTYQTQGVGIIASGQSTILFSNMDFGACGHAHIFASMGGQIGLYQATANATVPYTISGGAEHHCRSSDNSTMVLVGAAIIQNGTYNYSQSFALASYGQLHIYGTTFTGTATGVRWNSTNLGMILTNGGGATYLPGSIAGVTNANSVYA
jgi:hypothetical protein